VAWHARRGKKEVNSNIKRLMTEVNWGLTLLASHPEEKKIVKSSPKTTLKINNL
jgi:hypothetical protein